MGVVHAAGIVPFYLGRALGLMALLLLASTGFAQVNSTWNGSSGNNWSDATRWSTNPLFPNNGNGGNNYNAIVNAGTVVVDQPITIQALTFGGSATISRANN